jgi:hypothetical protein
MKCVVALCFGFTIHYLILLKHVSGSHRPFWSYSSHLGLLIWSSCPQYNVAAALLQHGSYAVFVHSVGAKNLVVDRLRLVVRHLSALQPRICAL